MTSSERCEADAHARQACLRTLLPDYTPLTGGRCSTASTKPARSRDLCRTARGLSSAGSRVARRPAFPLFPRSIVAVLDDHDHRGILRLDVRHIGGRAARHGRPDRRRGAGVPPRARRPGRALPPPARRHRESRRCRRVGVGRLRTAAASPRIADAANARRAAAPAAGDLVHGDRRRWRRGGGGRSGWRW